MQNKITDTKTVHQLALIPLFLRSLLFWIVVGACAVLYLLPALLLYFVVPLKTRHRIVISWGWVFTLGAKYICNVKYEVHGREHIMKTPSLIASNHQSMWETFGFTQIFPSHVWILKRELLKIPFFGWTVATVSPIAINRADRRGAVRQILLQGAERIKSGLWILLFPEGTRAKPGQHGNFKVGVGRLAIGLNVGVLPVAHNAGYVLPKNNFLVYPGTVRVIIGAPIYPQENETAEALTARIQHVVMHNLARITNG